LRASRTLSWYSITAATTGAGLSQCTHAQAGQALRSRSPAMRRSSGVAHSGQNLNPAAGTPAIRSGRCRQARRVRMKPRHGKRIDEPAFAQRERAVGAFDHETELLVERDGGEIVGVDRQL